MRRAFTRSAASSSPSCLEIVAKLFDPPVRRLPDLKFHDIPNTVAHAVSAAADMGVAFTTVHASGGIAMRLPSPPRPAVLSWLSALTSLDELAKVWARDRLDLEEEALTRGALGR